MIHKQKLLPWNKRFSLRRTQNVTRSLSYGGERWWKMLCIILAISNMIRNLTGSQWSCCRAAVIWDCRLRPRTSLAAEFWTRRRGESVDAGEGLVKVTYNTITYAVKLVVSWKLCKIKTLLLQNCNKPITKNYAKKLYGQSNSAIFGDLEWSPRSFTYR